MVVLVDARDFRPEILERGARFGSVSFADPAEDSCLRWKESSDEKWTKKKKKRKQKPTNNNDDGEGVGWGPNKTKENNKTKRNKAKLTEETNKT